MVMGALSNTAIARTISWLELLCVVIMVTVVAALEGGAALAELGNSPLAGFTEGSVSVTAIPDAGDFLMSGPVAPGDHVVRGITVTNRGSLSLRYAVTSFSVEDGLASWLDLTVWEEAAEADTDDNCGQQPPSDVLYGPADPGSPAGVRVIGNPAQGLQPGDRKLQAGASEKLCFLLAVPLSAGNAFQSSKASPEFRFDAEQTDGNP